MPSVVMSFSIGRRDTTVLPCEEGAVTRQRLFSSLRTLASARPRV